MTRDAVANIDEKFFFDQNIFDENNNLQSTLLDEEPPPPVFSEEELAAAKKAAFQDGHNQATQEAKNSRSQHLATVLEVLTKDMATLFDQESAREKIYERETVELTSRVFEKLFPYYAEQTGFGELSAALENIIQKQSQRQAILVRVATDLAEGVEKFLQKLQAQNQGIRFTVQGDAAIQGTACALSWENGGAVHDTDAMAEEIAQIIKDGLAAGDTTRHDNKDSQLSEAGDPHEISEPHPPEAGDDNPSLKEKPDE